MKEAVLPNAVGSLYQSDSGAFCVKVGQEFDVFLTRPAGAGGAWTPITVSDSDVLAYGNNGMLTVPLGETPGVFDAVRPGTVTLSSSLPGGRTWTVTIVVGAPGS